MNRLKRAVLLVAALALPSAPAAPGGEGLTAAPPSEVTPGLEKGDQRWPAVAAGKDVYLVVWQEGEAMAGVKDTSIMAARVAADGKPLDAKGFPVSTAKGFQAYPAATFDGTNFLVAWQDYRGGQDWDVYAARVTPEGKVLDPDGFAVASGPGNQIYPTLASDGKRALAVWSDVRPGFQPEVYCLYGTFVQDGKPAQAGGQELAKGSGSMLMPQVGWDGGGFPLVANHGVTGWEPGEPYAARVGADGKVQPWKLPAFRAQTFTLACDPAAAKSLVWSNSRMEHGSYSAVYMTAVQSAKGDGGARHLVLGLQGKFPPRNDLWCAAAFDGKAFVAVVEQSDIGQRKEESFSHLPPPAIYLAATRVDPAAGAALDAGTCLVTDAMAKPNATDMRRATHSKECTEAAAKAQPAPKVAAEAGVQLRQPAMASLGGGKSLLVYSRRGGVDKFKICAVLLSE